MTFQPSFLARPSAQRCYSSLLLAMMLSPLVAYPRTTPLHAITVAPVPPKAVRFEKTIYVSLGAIADLLGGDLQPSDLSAIPLPASLHLNATGKSWAFPNGGDRILDLTTKKEQLLRHPLLVLNGRHYAPAEEAAPIFGYAVELEPRLRFTAAGRILEPALVDAGSSYLAHDVSGMAIASAELVTTAELPVRASLHKEARAQRLAPGTRLLQRRTFVVDGEPAALVTDASDPAHSFVVGRKELAAASKARSLDATLLMRQQAWFRDAASRAVSLRSGPREQLPQTACVTVDFCWSMRRFENPLFESLRHRKPGSQETVRPVFFISGRWLAQHPEEMHNLIVLGQEPGMAVTWGLHSWIHPKDGGFMNDLSPEEVRKDTLRLEEALLRWGIVPTVFYRFPGLVHDEERLRTILEMGLFSIDCESWLAMRVNNEEGPFAQPVQDGSIILVHGNGNEPKGIAAFRNWLQDHGEWRLGDVANFLPRD